MKFYLKGISKSTVFDYEPSNEEEMENLIRSYQKNQNFTIITEIDTRGNRRVPPMRFVLMVKTYQAEELEAKIYG